MANDNLTLSLSAAELRALTNWPETVINDYISRAEEAQFALMQIGGPSPEGVVPANKSRQYFSTDDQLLYVNPAVGSKTGWVAI